MSSIAGFQEDAYGSYPVGSGHPQEMILPTPDEQAGGGGGTGDLIPGIKASWLELGAGIAAIAIGLSGKAWGIGGKNNPIISMLWLAAGAYGLYDGYTKYQAGS